MLKKEIVKRLDIESTDLEGFDLESLFSSGYESNMPSFDIYKAGVGSNTNIIKYWMTFSGELADKSYEHWDDASLTTYKNTLKNYVERIRFNIKNMTNQTSYKPVSVFMSNKLNDLTTPEAISKGDKHLKRIFDNNNIAIKESVPVGELVYDARSHGNRNKGKYIGLILAGLPGVLIGAAVDAMREKNLKTIKISTADWVKIYTEFNTEVYKLITTLRKTVSESIRPIK